jgi:hypothetical protein
VAIECKDVDICAYELNLELHDNTPIPADIGPKSGTNPPKYIPNDQDYVDGWIKEGEQHYYYLPYDPDDGDLLIFLNKTNPIGQEGDMALHMNIERDGSKEYKRWNLPKTFSSTLKSQTNNAHTPEIIDLSGNSLVATCGSNNENCVLIFMVEGLTTEAARYRMRVFRG